MSKLFGIGLLKTGTASLCQALELLGYSAIHNPKPLERLADYDAASDSPVADAFEALDRIFPGSKFIYTTRERTPWLRSVRCYPRDRRVFKDLANHRSRAANRRLYGLDRSERALLSEAYDRHDRRVRAYFRDRPGDLLVIDLCEPSDKWPKLCRFLGQAIPDVAFPWTGRTRYLWLPRAKRLHKLPKRFFRHYLSPLFARP